MQPTVLTCRSLYAGGFVSAAHPSSSRLPWPSPVWPRLGSLLSPCGGSLPTRQDSLDVTAGQVAHPTGGLCRGASAVGFLLALAASYGAAWSLPRPDSHRQADGSFSWTHATRGNRAFSWAGPLPPPIPSGWWVDPRPGGVFLDFFVDHRGKMMKITPAGWPGTPDWTDWTIYLSA